MKKTLLLLGTCLSLVSLGGCKKEDPRKSRSKQFSFSYFRSGYGTEWVKQVADYYMDNQKNQKHMYIIHYSNLVLDDMSYVFQRIYELVHD